MMRISSCVNQETKESPQLKVLQYSIVPETNNDVIWLGIFTDKYIWYIYIIFFTFLCRMAPMWSWSMGGSRSSKCPLWCFLQFILRLRRATVSDENVLLSCWYVYDLIFPTDIFAGPPSKPLLPAVPETRGRPLSTSYLKLPQLP